MNTTNLKIILRSLKKQKLASLLSIIVLTIGMASFMLIFFFIQYENSFDESWEKSGQVYRVALEKTLKNGNKTATATNYAGLCRVITDEIPGVQSATGLWADVVTAYTTENFLKDAKLFWGDASCFSVFNQPFVAGWRENPFPTIQSALISESTAIRLFGRSDALHQRFKLNQGWEFIVSGVFADIPGNSHLKIDFLLSRESLFYYMRHFDDNTSTLRLETVQGSNEPAPTTKWLWENPQAYTYIRLKDHINIASVEDKFQQIYQKYTPHLLADGQKSQFILQPISSIHFGSHLEQELSPNSDRKTMAALYVVAFLVLVMSWIIFINFQIAQTVERAKEIGLKKVVGASSYSLSGQIVLQSILINLIGMALSFAIFFLVRGRLSQYLEIQSAIPVNPLFLMTFVAVFLSGALLSGFYLAFVLVSKKAQMLLSKKFLQNNDGFSLRRSLIIFQFVASIGLLIATSVIIKQVSYMKSTEVGLNIDQSVFSYTPMSMINKAGGIDKLVLFMQELKRISGVKAATVSSCIPGKEINFHSNTISTADHPEKKGDNFGIINIDKQFQDVFNPKVLAGRLFSEADQVGGRLLVINREASQKLGFSIPEAAIGQFVQVRVTDYMSIPETPYHVCGVVEDFHQESLRKPIEPILLMNNLRWKYDVGYISVLLDKGDVQQTLEAVKQTWNSFYPNDPFGFQFTNDTYQEQMKADEKVAGIFTTYTGLSIFLAALGLFGLAANTAKKRIKEIGIRKINGAKVSEVMAMLNRDFVKWVAIAFVIATPVAWYAMNKWLESFAYKTELSWWIFALAGLLALGIALLTVSWQSWKAATRNPVEALRYE